MHLSAGQDGDGPHGRELLKNRTTRKRYDKTRYRNRHQVERCFNRLKQCRRVATRYEKTIENFARFVWLAALVVDVI